MPLAALGVAFAALAVVSVLLEPLATGPAAPDWLGPLWTVTKFTALGGIAVAVLRADDVAAVDLGFSGRLLRPGVGAFAALWVAVNLLAVAVAAATGETWGVDVLLDLPARWPGLPAAGVTTVAFEFLVVGLLEELVFRGYLQSKVLALLGDDTRLRIALGIAVASLAFGLLHAPAVVAAGGSLPAVAVVVLARAGTGLAFGTVYELTGNLYLLTLLHGLGNTWVLAADWSTFATEPLAVFFGGVLFVYAATVVGYRRWMAVAGHPVGVQRIEASGPPEGDAKRTQA